MADHIAATPPLLLPPICCCCLGAADTTYEVSGKTHKESGSIMVTKWRLPVCLACGERLTKSGARRTLSVLVVCIAIIASVWLAVRFGWWPDVFVVAAGLAGAVTLWRGTMGAPAIVGWTVLDEAQDCAWIRARHELVRACQIPRFENGEYERQFRELNATQYGAAARVEDGRRAAEAAHAFSLK